ncbi:hypothetical protein OC861_000635 [Tilletia horrida]|nr:hypothetical protein OC861_000635 [Tilletia horrida]
MQRQRRELIRQLDILLFTLFVYIWFLDKNLLLLALKIGLQVQYCNPTAFNPDLPLPILCRTVLFFNLAPIISHGFFWTGKGMSPLDDVDGTGIGGTYNRSGRTGFVLDFIGQSYQPTRLHLLCLDLLTAFLQWLFIIIVSETEKAEDLRPDLDEFGPLDGEPLHEVLLVDPHEDRPYSRRPSSKRDLSDRPHRHSTEGNTSGDRIDGMDDDGSDADSDTPLRAAEGSDMHSRHTSRSGQGDAPAVPSSSQINETRTRRRRGRRREDESSTNLLTPEGANSSDISTDPHGQGWSPRDEEASLFLPHLRSGSDSPPGSAQRPHGRILLSERTSLTHPVVHLPIGRLLRNTFTFVPLSSSAAPDDQSAASGQGVGPDNRPIPAGDATPGLTRSERITPGGGGARAGRMVGSLGIVPMFRRYREGEEAVTASGERVRAPRSPSSQLPPNTIPVIALPFNPPTLRRAQSDDPDVSVQSEGAVPASATPSRQDNADREENSWAWVARNFSVTGRR